MWKLQHSVAMRKNLIQILARFTHRLQVFGWKIFSLSHRLLPMKFMRHSFVWLAEKKEEKSSSHWINNSPFYVCFALLTKKKGKNFCVEPKTHFLVMCVGKWIKVKWNCGVKSIFGGKLKARCNWKVTKTGAKVKLPLRVGLEVS